MELAQESNCGTSLLLDLKFKPALRKKKFDFYKNTLD